MNKHNFKKRLSSVPVANIIIILASIMLVYLLIAVYFTNHFFFHTAINGVNLSLKAYEDANHIIINYTQDYELQLLERNGEIDVISGQDIGLQYNEKNSIAKIYKKQKSLQWVSSLFMESNYYVTDLYTYDTIKLEDRMKELKCNNIKNVNPKNVSFQYSNGTYTLINEVYGNKIIKDKLYNEIKKHIVIGKTSLDLDLKHCYENPKYVLRSAKTLKTNQLLDQYVATKITYRFGNEYEILDGNIINKWLTVDENLDVIINNTAVMTYVKGLSYKYDTVGVTRSFKATSGRTVEIKGGLYGWKISQEEEIDALFEHIKHGDITEKEPIYTQKALSRDGNEIGNTYLEINITKQYLWFYKEGKLITQGAIVTGNPNRGNATVVGAYMLNYKQSGATLKGPGYEVKVNYWMPFYGNMGIHDASWRYSFGGEIYKRNGTHGCVNAPLYLAKKIFENIEESIPIISYEEEKP